VLQIPPGELYLAESWQYLADDCSVLLLSPLGGRTTSRTRSYIRSKCIEVFDTDANASRPLSRAG